METEALLKLAGPGTAAGVLAFGLLTLARVVCGTLQVSVPEGRWQLAAAGLCCVIVFVIAAVTGSLLTLPLASNAVTAFLLTQALWTVVGKRIKPEPPEPPDPLAEPATSDDEEV